MSGPSTATGPTLRGRAAIVGIGQSPISRRGRSGESEFKLLLRAVLDACADAGVQPRDIDGLASFGSERNEPTRLASALGLRRLRATPLQWGGGGGGCCAAVANAAAAVATGMASCVLVYRALAQRESGRFGQGPQAATADGDRAYLDPYGVTAPPQRFAMQFQRFLERNAVQPSALRAIALASYRHAQTNPRAVMHGRPLDEATYDAARWITEPLRLYDCCMETDGAAAILVVAAERANDFAATPVYLLGAACGASYRAAAPSHNDPNYGTAGQRDLARDLYAMAALGCRDVGVVQCYANFTPAVAMALLDHGFFEAEQINEFLIPGRLSAPSGELPLNTAGGPLAEGYLQGLELIVEAVRQVRGQSCNQVSRRDVALVIGAPAVAPTSNLLLGSGSAL